MTRRTIDLVRGAAQGAVPKLPIQAAAATPVGRDVLRPSSLGVYRAGCAHACTAVSLVRENRRGIG